MRILQTLDASANFSLSSNKTWYRNLYEPLVDLGHKVVFIPAQEGRIAMRRKDKKIRANFSEKMLRTFKTEHKKEPFDLFFAYLMDGMVEPVAIDEIRKTGVPTCNFSCNNAHQFFLVEGISPHFDYNLHSEKDAREKFIEIGANPLWWPMASNPKYFKPYNIPRTIPVSFVGTNYALRAKYIEYLLKNNIEVHAYGPGWKYAAKTPFRSVAKRYLWLVKALASLSPEKQHRFSSMLANHDFRRSMIRSFPQNLHHAVSDEALIKLYSRSHISLGFLEVYNRHDPSKLVTQHLHLREFEAPMSGALYCTNFSDELCEFFEPDKEVLVYRNQQELLDKVRFYLANQNNANTIRQAGRKRALMDHTYHKRYKSLFKAIGLNTNQLG